MTERSREHACYCPITISFCGQCPVNIDFDLHLRPHLFNAYILMRIVESQTCANGNVSEHRSWGTVYHGDEANSNMILVTGARHIGGWAWLIELRPRLCVHLNLHWPVEFVIRVIKVQREISSNLNANAAERVYMSEGEGRARPSYWQF
jgi:hypothetical protein